MMELMPLTSDDLWVIAIACLVGVSCALVGVFLVVRQMAMLGDAISHSVLFGIVLGFLLTGSRSIGVMILSAGLVGLLTAYITSALNRVGQLQEDASIGVTFTCLFAMGVILVSAFAGSIDLDQECVLYGELAFAPFDRLMLGGIDYGPRSFWLILGVLLATLTFVLFSFRRLELVCFDPVLAISLGISVPLWHYLLMTFVSLVTVASFDAVGAILVVALLVAPASSAYLVARSLEAMILFASLFAIIAAISGFYLALSFDASISASIALNSGILFILVHIYQLIQTKIGLKRPGGAI